MPETLLPVDLDAAPADQPAPLHNRWHPDIPPVVSVRPGAVFRVECLDWTGGQIGNNDSANDVRDVDLLQVHYGQVRGAAFDRIAREAARTVPGRENGGNCDIKNLSRGSRIYFPVFIPGASLSLGDIHFSQGDGEITFCGAIEMAGYVDLHVDVIKDGMNRYPNANPIFEPGPVEPRHSRYLVFEGISVREDGEQTYLDAHVAYRRACLNAIEYLTQFGYTDEQAYIILGTAPVEGRISGIVDIPNAVCTLYVPMEIFEFDIRPSAGGPRVEDRGQVAVPG